MFSKKSVDWTQESCNVEKTLNKCQQIMCDHIEVNYFSRIYVCTLLNCFPSSFYGKIKRKKKNVGDCKRNVFHCRTDHKYFECRGQPSYEYVLYGFIATLHTIWGWGVKGKLCVLREMQWSWSAGKVYIVGWSLIKVLICMTIFAYM